MPAKLTCSWCREIKPTADFMPKKNFTGYDGVCRECRGDAAGEATIITDADAAAMCRRKHRYSTQDFAVVVATEAVLKGRKTALRPYSCPVCGGWHNTSSQAREEQKALAWRKKPQRGDLAIVETVPPVTQGVFTAAPSVFTLARVISGGNQGVRSFESHGAQRSVRPEDGDRLRFRVLSRDDVDTDAALAAVEALPFDQQAFSSKADALAFIDGHRTDIARLARAAAVALEAKERRNVPTR